MYWKFVLVNLLLVLPDCRIFIGGTSERAEESIEDVLMSENGPLVEKIVFELSRKRHQENIPRDSVDKADQLALAQDTNSNNNNGINLAAEDSGAGKPKTVDAPPGNKSEGQSQVLAAPGETAPLQQPQHGGNEDRRSKFIEEDDKRFIIVVAVAVCTGFIGLMMAGVCYYKFRKSAKAASDVEYPAYGVTGPMKEKIPSPGDRKLAQSAQMYHYQHQKQQMIAMEKANGDMKHDASEDDSEEDNVEGDYTVYECPGLAPTGEMEVRNPLFRGEDTPVSPGQDITGQPLGTEPLPEQGFQQK